MCGRSRKVRMDFGRFSIILWLGCLSTATAQLVFMERGVLKFITGLGIPIDSGLTGGTMSVFTNFQAFFKLPTNFSNFEPYRSVQKRSVKDTFNRLNLYQAFAKYFGRLGLSGNECIHRMVCEVASRKITDEEFGLFGEIVHILFSPENEEGLEEYKTAQRQGLYNSSACEDLYSDCYLCENSMFLG